MVGSRDTPPSIQDGPFGWEPTQADNFDKESRERTPKLDSSTAEKVGKEIWESSTNWLNAGRRARWNDSLRAFQSLHPSGSKYLSGDYRFRSTLYRPKTRAMTRRDEAATASAFFSNEDVVSIEAANDGDPQQRASAAIMSSLLQYRLTKTIPWFMTLVGARQDANVLGICVARAGWEYEEQHLRTEQRPKLDQLGQPLWDDDLGDIQTEEVDLYEVRKDEPFVNLIAPENFRFEPGCDWRNPVKSSPYLIELEPFYIGEALLKMEGKRGAPPEWNYVETSALRNATDLSDDVTRRTREAGRVPGKDHDAWKPQHFEIFWTRNVVMRWRGEDWCFRTLAGGGQILEPPRPIREVHLHGERPYVVGSVVLETHKTYPSSKIELVTDLQRAANQDWNSRFDNIMLSLQPRQFVKEGAGQDINDLRTFIPGKVIPINTNKEPITNVVTWDRPPPVDGAAFQEQDRINLDWDDLAGSFTNSSVRSSEVSAQSATGMHLMSGEASGLNEYELRIFAETFAEPLLRLLVKLEQAYETNPTILAIAGQNAQLLEKFGVSQITDELLQAEVTTRVNVGIGATNPQMKLRNFATGAQIIASIFGPIAAQGANFQEISKEVFAMLGYKDGSRFFQAQFDPRVAQLQQELQKLQGKQGQGQGGETPAATAAKIQVANINAQSKQRSDEMRAQTDARNAELDFHTQKMEEDAETQREMMKLHGQMVQQHADHQHDHQMGAIDHQRQMQMGAVQHAQGMQQAQMGMQHDQQMGEADRQHETKMGEEQRGFEGRKQEGQWSHDSQMQKMQPTPMKDGKPASRPPSGNYQLPSMQPPAPPPPPPQPAPQPMPPQQPQPDIAGMANGFTSIMQQMMATMQQMQQGDAQIVNAIGQIAQMMAQTTQTSEQGNAQIAQMVAQATQASEQANAQIANAMQVMAQSVNDSAGRGEASHRALIGAITRPKRIKRGADGRVEGLE